MTYHFALSAMLRSLVRKQADQRLDGQHSHAIANYDDIIMNNLEKYSELFEELKLRCDKVEVEEKDIDNLRDLNYLALDTLFLTMDLKNFYKLGESERFKMRAVNYINKRSRGQIL